MGLPRPPPSTQKADCSPGPHRTTAPGRHSINFVASDGLATYTQEVDIDVSNVNFEPTTPLRLKKVGGRLLAAGRVSPDQVGKSVQVALYKKRAGRFVLIVEEAGEPFRYQQLSNQLRSTFCAPMSNEGTPRRKLQQSTERGFQVFLLLSDGYCVEE